MDGNQISRAKRQWGSALARQIVRRILAEMHVKSHPCSNLSQKLYRAVQEELDDSRLNVVVNLDAAHGR